MVGVSTKLFSIGPYVKYLANCILLLSSSLPVEHKVDTSSLHSALFLALFSASPQVSLSSLSSVSTVLRHVVFGLPLGLFPCGVHLSAAFVMHLLSILKTCPSHLNLFCKISSTIHMESAISRRFTFEMVLGQTIL